MSTTQEPEINLIPACLEGTRLSEAEVASLEARVAESPEDLETRAKLLGWYLDPRRRSAETSQARLPHVLWVLKNRPDLQLYAFVEVDPDTDGQAAFNLAREVILESVQIHSTNPGVISTAAMFFTSTDRALAEDLLSKGAEVEPHSPYWHARLAHLQKLGKEHGKAFRSYELALEKASDSETRFHLLPRAAEAAVDANEWERAVVLAEESLQVAKEFTTNECHGDAIHHGHVVLGRHALRSGEIDKARAHLMESVNTRGSPVLCSFGPTMTLAQDLLERGDRDLVLSYLDACAQFWRRLPGAQHPIPIWREEILAGEMPDLNNKAKVFMSRFARPESSLEKQQ